MKNNILKSKSDRKIFFEGILNPPNPNQKLIKAVKNYKKEYVR